MRSGSGLKGGSNPPLSYFLILHFLPGIGGGGKEASAYKFRSALAPALASSSSCCSQGKFFRVYSTRPALRWSHLCSTPGTIHNTVQVTQILSFKNILDSSPSRIASRHPPCMDSGRLPALAYSINSPRHKQAQTHSSC